MERWVDYHIEQIPSGQKISGFLKGKGYSEQNLVNLKKDAASVWVNGTCVHQNYVLRQGDDLRVCIRELGQSEQIVPVELPLAIVYEDEDLMVVNKPAGMPIHPSRNNVDNSLGNALAWYFKQKNEPFVFRCINRLDRDTSGLTIVAKHMVSSAILGRMITQKEQGAISRQYLAVVEGKMGVAEGTVNMPIVRKESRCLERVVDEKHGAHAVTHYRVVKSYENCSLVECRLETGRTHQIRVHMKYIGHPLIGDFLYNPNYAGNQIDRVETGTPEDKLAASYPIQRQALHAYRLAFVHPMTGAYMEFEVPMPEDMERILQR